MGKVLKFRRKTPGQNGKAPGLNPPSAEVRTDVDSDLAAMLNQGGRGRNPTAAEKAEAQRLQNQKKEQEGDSSKEGDSSGTVLRIMPKRKKFPSLAEMREFFRESD